MNFVPVRLKRYARIYRSIIGIETEAEAMLGFEIVRAAGFRVTMGKLKIAAIRSGTEPVGKLPEGSFHRWLDEPLYCPKCDAIYNLVVDYDQFVDRFFAESSRRLVMMLKKAVFMGHGDNHRVTHFETEGVVVRNITSAESKTAG